MDLPSSKMMLIQQIGCVQQLKISIFCGMKVNIIACQEKQFLLLVYVTCSKSQPRLLMAQIWLTQRHLTGSWTRCLREWPLSPDRSHDRLLRRVWCGNVIMTIIIMPFATCTGMHSLLLVTFIIWGVLGACARGLQYCVCVSVCVSPVHKALRRVVL